MKDMPEVLLGETVFWFPGGQVTEPPQVAVVTGVGSDCVGLNVLAPWDDRVRSKEGVRHVDDQRAKSQELFEAGGWCHRSDYFARPDVPDEAKRRAGSKQAAERIRRAYQEAQAQRHEGEAPAPAKKQPVAAGAK